MSRVASSFLIRSSASRPLMSGSFMSRSARSTGMSGLASIASPCSAVSLTSTWYPSPSRTSWSVRRMFFSSSTTRTVFFPGEPEEAASAASVTEPSA